MSMKRIAAEMFPGLTRAARRAAVSRLADMASGGLLTPEAIVAEASDTASSLHMLFEWDDSRAAHLYRISQARKLIAAFRITEVIGSQSVVVTQAPAFVRDPRLPSGTPGYVSVQTAKSDEDLRAEILRMEIRRCRALIHRVQELAQEFGLDVAPQVLPMEAQLDLIEGQIG